MSVQKLINYKKTNKAPVYKIDELINKIFSAVNDSSQNIVDSKIKTENKKWVMPEEPRGFIKCKKHDPL
ncbi:MAG TPA: hypothetical protein VIH86_12235 [Puia sp.]|jgi:hypothetical protein